MPLPIFCRARQDAVRDSPAPRSRLEFWVGADTAADNLLALQSAGAGGCALVDPQHGWSQVRRFDTYEAAYCWLTREAYEPVEQR